MTERSEPIHGLSCPHCGGMVPIPEGQALVICPYCDQRSVVAVSSPASSSMAALLGAGGQVESAFPPGIPVGSAVAIATSLGKGADSNGGAGNTGGAGSGALSPSIGVRRYQAPLRVDRDGAVRAMQRFLTGKMQVARDAAREAKISEVFLVHLPFWAVWARGVAYAFGQVQVGSGDHKRYEAREKKAVRELTWNCPACEVGEFGVRQIGLDGEPGSLGLQPFNAEALHRTGMVFEPVGAEQAAMEEARKSFEETIRGELRMDRTAQVFTRLVRPRMGLLYYPLWVVRYLYRGRAFQVVVDGSTSDGDGGRVLYGKAPGSVAYRAAMLVGGMAVGALVAIDVPALILSASDSSSKSSDNSVLFALIVFIVGLGIMFTGYRTFRYAEHYEYHRFGKSRGAGSEILNLPGGMSKAIDIIGKFT